MTIKIAHINTNHEEQSLIDHSRNTFKEVEQHARSLQLENFIKLASLLHDCGKASDDFQNYIKKAANGIKTYGKVNHSSAGAQILFEICKEQDTSPYDKTLKIMLAYCIVSHHGLKDFVDENGCNKFEESCYPPNRESNSDLAHKDLDLKNVWSYFNQFHTKEEILDLYMNAKEEVKKYLLQFKKNNKGLLLENKEICFNCGAFQRLLLSLLIHGDREDTRAFMDNITKKDTLNYMEVWNTSIYELESHIEKIQNECTKSKINKLRKDISETCNNASNKATGIYRLSCPTGSGKTLASLRFALHHAKKYEKKHIIYVAPFKTILEQTADVLKEFFKQDEILEHHSNIVSQNHDYDYYCSSWEKPVIMTTAVRFFDTLFSDRTTNIRRFHQLTNSVIIFDEVQSVPIKLIYMFNCMMNFLANYCNTTLLLCTATQPLLNKVKYPIQLSESPDIVEHIEELTTEFKRVHIEDASYKKYSMEELSEFVFQKMNTSNSTLVIVNTKQDALDLYEACKQRDVPGILLCHLSTKMCPEHRSTVFKKIKGALGKQPIICISTNLIEAGIDISFDIVVRCLCGLSSILQAAGRCNRHGDNETLGTVYLVESKSESIDKLPDIEKGKENMCAMLKQMHRSGFNPNIDKILSLQYINEYYETYYHERKTEMDYTNDKAKPLFQLMSTGVLKTKNEKPTPPNLYVNHLGQSLKTAGHIYEAIDSTTIGIIVPYGRGKELIQMLNGSIHNTEKYKLLDEVQRYTINVYESSLKQLRDKEIIQQIDFNGIYVLKDGHYKDDIGIDMQKNELDTLFV